MYECSFKPTIEAYNKTFNAETVTIRNQIKNFLFSFQFPAFIHFFSVRLTKSLHLLFYYVFYYPIVVHKWTFYMFQFHSKKRKIYFPLVKVLSRSLCLLIRLDLLKYLFLFNLLYNFIYHNWPFYYVFRSKFLCTYYVQQTNT